VVHALFYLNFGRVWEMKFRRLRSLLDSITRNSDYAFQ
jgi:hypothetical protein